MEDNINEIPVVKFVEASAEVGHEEGFSVIIMAEGKDSIGSAHICEEVSDQLLISCISECSKLLAKRKSQKLFSDN